MPQPFPIEVFDDPLTSALTHHPAPSWIEQEICDDLRQLRRRRGLDELAGEA